MAPREDVRRALIRRVTGKVSGHGITRRSIEGAVDRVLAALPAIPMLPQTAAAAADSVAVLSAPSAPDLPSRARRLLGRQGAEITGMGIGTSGRHTVVTLRLSGNARPLLESAATELGATLTFLDPADASRLHG